MLEKLLYSVGGLTLAFSGVAGYAWVEGDLSPGPDTSVVASRPTSAELAPGVHGYGNATPLPSPRPKPTRRPAEPVEPTDPPVVRTLARDVVPMAPVEQLPATDPLASQSDLQPDLAPQSQPASQGSGARFTIASFNLLGSSHTNKGGHSAHLASGPERMPGALQILAQHQVSVAGLQEFQPDQRAAFQRQATGWAMYPGLSMGRRAGENSVAWRTDTWTLVKPGLVDIPYFNGRIRPMPYVLLRHTGTGALAYFSTFHNPANIGGNMQRWRTEATTREIALFNKLEASGIPQFVTGDMNERSEYFCRVTGSTSLLAAAGGSNNGSCRPPKQTLIDWIFGSPGAAFSNFRVDRSALVRRTTDHPVVVADVSLTR